MNPDSDFPVLLLCEHAGNRLPPEVPAYLGMDNDFIDSYHGYDIGIPHVARKVAQRLNATCILGIYSRLLIDLNRSIDSPDLLHDHDDYIVIPGNQNLSVEELQRRIDAYHTPYHTVCAHHIERLMEIYDKPAVFSFHSFPRHQTSYPEPFPWNFTIHHRNGLGLEDIALSFFQNNYPEVKIGNNDPYDLKSLPSTCGFMMHGEERGLPNLLIEVPNDQMRDPEGIEKWSNVCQELIETFPAALRITRKAA